jgi:hypothetical protein
MKPLSQWIVGGVLPEPKTAPVRKGSFPATMQNRVYDAIVPSAEVRFSRASAIIGLFIIG